MGNEKNIKGKNDNYRRTWDPAEYGIKAKLRADEKVGKTQIKNVNNVNINIKEGEKPMKELLKAREYLVDLEKQVGKSFVINKTIGTMADGGYYCDVCDCSLRDSSNFLDHINGKKHQANLGIKLKVERSSLDQVKERIKLMSQKKQQEKSKVKKEYDIDESIAIAKDMVIYILLNFTEF